MRILWVLVVFFWGFVAQVRAAPELVVTSSEVQPDGYKKYFYTVTGWYSTDKGYTSCGAWNQIPTDLCFTTLFLYYKDGSNEILQQWLLPGGKENLTLGDVVRLHNANGLFYMPFSRSVLDKVKNSDPTCMLIEVGVSWSAPLPITNCAPVAPAPVRCDIGGKNTIDHKTLSDNALDGAQASTQLDIKCAGNASVVVKATRTNSWGVMLRNNGSLYTEVKINGKDATNGINMAITSNLSAPLIITSTLKTRGVVAPGPFSGSTVVTVMPN